MQDLTFGEQVKIVLSRKNMTIKDLARKIEIRTKKKMSRQNLTQRLGRDNFQEQDMRLIASILGCPFKLSILEEDTLEKQEERTEDEMSNLLMAADMETCEADEAELSREYLKRKFAVPVLKYMQGKNLLYLGVDCA